MSSEPLLLVVDDDAAVGRFVGEAVRELGFRSRVLADASEFDTALGEDVALVMLDLQMPGVDGIELLRHLGRRRSSVGVVLMSGFDENVLRTAEELARSLGLEVLGSLAKPIRLAPLRELLQRHGSSARRPDRRTPGSPEVSPDAILRAIRSDELLLHFQPQLESATGRLVGFEALVRWRQPSGALVFPDSFIPVAEEAGLIDELGWVVFRDGIAASRRLRERCGPVGMSMNVSARSLHDLEMPDRLARLASEAGVPPSSITLEITESGLVKEPASALDILARIRMKEMRLAIDDFGTGYSMMQQLRRVPATELKIDKAFVQGAVSDATARVVVTKTIEIGHELGMRVVAEGVETAEQLALLARSSCEVVQGYLFARPMPEAQLLEWVDADRPAWPPTA